MDRPPGRASGGIEPAGAHGFGDRPVRQIGRERPNEAIGEDRVLGRFEGELEIEHGRIYGLSRPVVVKLEESGDASGS